MRQRMFVYILILFIALGICGLANAAEVPIQQTKEYKQLKTVVDKISAKPAAYKKDRPNGFAWAKKNIADNLKKTKDVVWGRYKVKLTTNVDIEKKIYNNLTYKEAIRHALSMAALDPLVKESKDLVSKISRATDKRCIFRITKKPKKKNRKAWKKYKKQKAKNLRLTKKCKTKKSKIIKQVQAKLKEVNAKLEPAKQQKIADHIKKTNEINSIVATWRIALNGQANGTTVQELHAATKIANQARVKIGLSKLPLPNPKMYTVASPAQSEFWGLMAGGPVDLFKAARSGIGTQRGLLWWPGAVVKGKPGVFNWTSHDRSFRAAAMAGIRTAPTFYGGRNNSFKLGPADWKSYKQFATAAVKRYGPGGSFWKENPGVPYLPVTTWEVWNEPNLRTFAPGNKVSQKTVVLYKDFFVGVSRAIKAADKNAIVMVGGLANIQSTKMPVGIPGHVFLKKLYKYPEFRASFDALAFHPYNQTVQGMAADVEQIRSILDANGDNNKYIHINEIGWATDGPPGPVVVSRQKQAENLTAAMNWFRATKDKNKIAMVAWYFWQDVDQAIGGGKTKNWDSYAGLFDVKGNPKPAWYAWLKITGGS